MIRKCTLILLLTMLGGCFSADQLDLDRTMNIAVKKCAEIDPDSQLISINYQPFLVERVQANCTAGKTGAPFTVASTPILITQ